jgi:predicted nucleotidyltransferase
VTRIVLAGSRNDLDVINRSSRIEQAILFGSRARGDYRPDSDADVALILESGNEWPVLETLAGLAFFGKEQGARAEPADARRGQIPRKRIPRRIPDWNSIDPHR